MLIPSFTYSFLYIYPYYNTVGRQKRFCSFRNPKKKQNGQFLILERLDRLERLMTAHKEVLTFEETCDYTGISRSYLYKLTSSGNIPHSKPNGKLIFFEKKKLNDWLLQNGILHPSHIDSDSKGDSFKITSS